MPDFICRAKNGAKGVYAVSLPVEMEALDGKTVTVLRHCADYSLERLMQRKGELETELAEIDSILHQISEGGD